MILSDNDIRAALSRGEITIDPLIPGSIQPASVDLHLGNHFKFYKITRQTVLDPRCPHDDLMDECALDDIECFILHPGQFALAMTLQRTGVDASHVGRLEGKSSLARMGLIVHTTAGFLDPGNNLNMTLELLNVSPLPIMLFPRMPIAQMAFERMLSPSENPYGKDGLNSKYYGDSVPQASKYHKNFCVEGNNWMSERQKGYFSRKNNG